MVTQEQQPGVDRTRDGGRQRPRAGDKLQPQGAVVLSAGAGPWPMRTTGRPGSCAVVKIAGMSPPGPLRCGSTTWSTNPAATAASKAFPPRSSTDCAVAVAIQCVEAAIPKVPRRVGRVVKAGGGVNADDILRG